MATTGGGRREFGTIELGDGEFKQHMIRKFSAGAAEAADTRYHSAYVWNWVENTAYETWVILFFLFSFRGEGLHTQSSKHGNYDCCCLQP